MPNRKITTKTEKKTVKTELTISPGDPNVN